MGFLDSLKGNTTGAKAYRTHISAMQLRKAGKYAESEAKLDEAIRLYGEAYAAGYRKTAALQGYALLLMRRGEFERAREIMLECSKDKSMSADDRFSLRIDFSICQWKMGKLDKAIETIQNAARAKKNGSVYTTLGMFLVEKARETGEFEEALAFNDEAMEYDDEDAGVLDNVGQLFMVMSEKYRADGDAEKASEYHEKALDALKKANELKPDQISSAYYLAKLLHEDGDDAKARELLDHVLKIPFSFMMQISRDEAEALRKAVG